MADPFDYLSSRDDADSLIQDFGAVATIRRVTNSGATPWAPSQSTTDYTTFAAVIDYTTQQRRDSDISATDQRALVAAGPLAVPAIVPQQGDLLVQGTTVYRIIKCTILAPAGTAVYFDCQVSV